MNIITTWNLKGGTGKTTTSFNLAATYAAQDDRCTGRVRRIQY